MRDESHNPNQENTMSIFLETLDTNGNNSGRVEEVDDYVFKYRTKTVNENGTPRYSGNQVVLKDGELSITWTGGDRRVVENISRLLGLNTSNTITQFCSIPQTVLIKGQGKAPRMYDLATQTLWRKA